MDWMTKSYRMATKVTRLHTIKFLPLGRLKSVVYQNYTRKVQEQNNYIWVH
jgi:hypothetical protein